MSAAPSRVSSRPSSARRHSLDEERFYCPYPGCSRSFAELWRLKVHYRAAPDVRGSGKERGHGAELKACPKCGTELKPGRHHVGCVAGKKRARRKVTARSSKQAGGSQRQKRRVEETSSSEEEWDLGLEEEDEDEEEEVYIRKRTSKSRRGLCSTGGQCSSRGAAAAVGTPTGTAMGIPANWIPMNFNLFDNRSEGFMHAGLASMPTSTMSPLGEDPSFDPFFCNQANSMWMCPTSQMGIGLELNLNSVLSSLDPGNCVPPYAAAAVAPYGHIKTDQNNLRLGPVQECSDLGPPAQNPMDNLQHDPSSMLQDHSMSKMDSLLDPFSMELQDGGLLDSQFPHLPSNSGQCDTEADFLLPTGPLWEPLSTPMGSIEQFFQNTGGPKDLLVNKRPFVTCPRRGAGDHVSG